MKKILFFLLLLRFYPMLFGKALFFGDNYSLLVPGKIFTAEWIVRGVLPLWNPFVLGGISWIGDINQSLTSLSTAFFVLFPAALALNMTVLTYSSVAFIGMYLFTKRWLLSEKAGVISALLWLFSASMTGSVNNISVLQSISLIPWVLFSSQFLPKASGGIGTALALTLMLLGGYPQYIPYALVLAAIFTFEKKSLKKWVVSWGVIGVIALGLSAFAWMPFIENVRQSTRSIQTATQSRAGGIHISDAVSIILPTLFSAPVSGMRWGPAWNAFGTTIPYVSWFGLFLMACVFVRRKHIHRDYIFLAVIVISSVLTTTNIVSFFPILSSSRGPELALVMIDVVTSIWIADLCVRILPLRIKKKWCVFFGALFGMLCIARLGVQINFAEVWKIADTLLRSALSNSAFHTLHRDEIITRHILNILIIHFAVFAALIFAYTKKRFTLIIFLLAIEMHVSTSSLLFFAPHDVYPSKQQIRSEPRSSERVLITNGNQPYTDFATYWEALRVRAPFSDSYVDTDELARFSALKRMRDAYTPNWNMVYGIHSLTGYVAFVPLDTNALWNTENDPAINFLPQIQYADPKLSDWGVAKILVDPFFPTVPDNPVRSLPKTSRFRLHDGTLISDESVEETPNTQKITLSGVPNGSELIIADRYDPNWTATVNDEPVTIKNTNGMRGIKLDEGNNDIVLSYWPKAFAYGIGISAITAVAVLVFYATTKQKTVILKTN